MSVVPGNKYTPREEVDAKLHTLRSSFKSGRTKNLRFRKWQLKQLYWLVEDNEEAISEALKKDLGRHEIENLTAAISASKADILDHIAHLEEWTADEYPGSGFLFSRLGSTVVRREPLGVVLIIGSWNFPILLALQPLMPAIAAGCTAMVKPSELSTHSEALLTELFPKYLDPSTYTIVTGGAQETQYILSNKFDHIFFTGSTPVAKHVAKAAAQYLTPTVLELGGQGPAIVTKTANVDLAAKRITQAKFVNAGQICLSVNHVFVDPAVHDYFIDRLAFWRDKFSGDEGEEDHMCKIINERNYDRDLLDRSKGKIVYGGSGDRTSLQLKSTVIDNVTLDDSLLESELFGPLLPVIVADYVEATRAIASKPHPLAIYIFSNSKPEIEYVLDRTLSGGVTINDCFLHAAAGGLPFGGVGDSGIGYYHGRHGVEAFTHKRVVVSLPNWLDKVMAGIRYPPYNTKYKKFFAVSNKLGFKRGETIEDQTIRSPDSSCWSVTGFVAVTAVLAVVVAFLASPENKYRLSWLDELLVNAQASLPVGSAKLWG